MNEKWGHPLKGRSREKYISPSKKIHPFFVGAKQNVALASLLIFIIVTLQRPWCMNKNARNCLHAVIETAFGVSKDGGRIASKVPRKNSRIALKIVKKKRPVPNDDMEKQKIWPNFEMGLVCGFRKFYFNSY